jgi:hypothetical protein
MSRGNVARLAAAAIATAQVMASPKEGEVGAVMAETLKVPGASCITKSGGLAQCCC